MIGVPFKDQNKVFVKPKSWTAEEHCYDLPCKVTVNSNYPAIESVFKLSDEEIDLIVKSKRIRLGILGQGMPPVYLQVEPDEVFGVNLDWEIKGDPETLENVMTPEECRCIGDYGDCIDFVAKYKPKTTTTDEAPATQEEKPTTS